MKARFIIVPYRRCIQLEETAAKKV